MKRFPYLLTVAALLWMGGSRPAAAQAQVFSDRATWSAAAGAVATRDFEELADFEPVETLSYEGVTFSSPLADPNAIVAISRETLPDSDLQSRVLASNLLFKPMIATFSPVVRSVGMDVVALYGSGNFTVTVVTGDGTQQLDVPLSNGSGFIGFKAESGITEVTVANPDGEEDDYVCVDNVSYGENQTTEDPALGSLDGLKHAVEAGIAGGSIKNLGNSLLGKIAEARGDVLSGSDADATGALKAFKNAVRAQTGKMIAPAKADELQALADECIAAIAL